jgi:para-nitrobenzyl esterase
MAMPRAGGLFHRAIVQSGSMTHMPGPEQRTKLAEAVVKALGISGANLGQLHAIPLESIVAAGAAAAKAVYPPPNPTRPIDFGRHAELFAWAPTVDGSILPESPFRDSAPAVSAKVPLLIGTTRTEFGA